MAPRIKSPNRLLSVNRLGAHPILERRGYRVEMVYLKLKSSRLAQKRIAARVREGGHDVPPSDVIRRFGRGWANFERVYQPLADAWAVYDNSGQEAQLLETSE